MRYLEASLALYARLGTEQTASRELSLVHFLSGAPLTQSLTNRTSEAFCWGLLALAQVNSGQVQPSIQRGRRALAVSQEIKNVSVPINSTAFLTKRLLQAAASRDVLPASINSALR